MREFTYKDYVESAAVRLAEEALNKHLASAPGEYESKWSEAINSALNGILNREKFNYHMSADPLYQQYKDRYVKHGKLAMQDTVGQASALTGGYSNSWAQTAGSQAYQGYLEGLNDMVPELYALAAERYDKEGADLLNKYSVLADAEATDYGKYRDTVADYQSERDYLAGRYDSERDFDYGKYSDDRNLAYTSYNDQRNYEYQLARAAAADAQWAAEMAYRAERDAIEDSRWQQEFDYMMSLNQASDTTPTPVVTPNQKKDNYTSDKLKDDGEDGISLTEEMLRVYRSYLEEGDFRTANDMLDTFRYNGINAMDINKCMYLMDYYHKLFNSSGGTPTDGLATSTPSRDKMQTSR